MTTLDALPRWDLTPLFPTVDHAEVAAAEGTLTRAVDALAALFDRRDVRGAADGASPAAAVDPAAFDEVLAATNHVLDRFARLEAFAYGHVSTDSGDEAAQALLSRLTTVEARITALRTRFDAWVGTLDLDALIAASPRGRRPRVAAAQGRPPGHTPDVRARGVPGRRAGHHRVVRLEPAVRRRQRRGHRHGRARRRAHRDPPDLRRPRPRHPPRRRGPRRRVPGRARRLAGQRHPHRRGPQRHQGRDAGAGRPPRLGRPPVPRARGQRRRARSLRRHAGRGRRLAGGLPPLPGGQGPAARQGPVRLLGPVRPRRRRPRGVVARRHGHGRAGLRRVRGRPGRPGDAGRSASAGSTRDPAPGRWAGPSACTRAMGPAGSS